jgi:hypothetical protein
MDPAWESQFRRRMRAFELNHATGNDGMPVSIKVRVTSGCFHREHSPQAYALIDERLDSTPSDAEFAFEEHESGPELLVLLALATSGLGLAKSIIDLIIAIIEARREGVARGDKPCDPIELIVRRMDGDALREETVLRIGHRDGVNSGEIEALVNDAIERLAGNEPEGSHPGG